MGDLGKKKGFEFPNSILILFIIVVAMGLLTYLLPAGHFGKIVDPVSGVERVDADTFEFSARTPVSPFRFFVAVAEGFIEAGNVIFLIIFAYFWVFSVVGSGAFSAAINNLLGSKAKDSKIIIPISIIIFALAGSTYGEYETVYGLLPIFIAIAIALGYDAIVGICMSFVGVAVGFASATTNPFTIGVAQAIAELPIFSGLAFRWVIWVVFVTATIIFTMRYAARVKADPAKSVVYGLDFSAFDVKNYDTGEKLTTKHKVLLLGMVVTVASIVVGSLKLGWYINEMSGVFLISGIVTQLIARKRLNEIGNSLATAAAEMAAAVIVVGLSRTILVVLRSGNIIDTVIYGLYLPIKSAPTWLVSELMLVACTIVNFFIPSGSGAAAATMPILIPLGDLMSINRQITVLAYQFGDGYSNIIWPTVCAIVCGIAKVPFGKWFSFAIKLFGILFVLQVIVMAVASIINYGPF
jgi:uncharacterized ion transporter superfamily protein YfcC